jgi:hypothetical protein
MAASAITSAVMTSQSLCSLQTVAHGPSVTSSSCSTSSGSQVSASNAPFLGGLQLRRNAVASRRASSTQQELRRSRLAALHVSAKKNDTPLVSCKFAIELINMSLLAYLCVCVRAAHEYVALFLTHFLRAHMQRQVLICFAGI